MKKVIILYTANLCQRVEDLFSLEFWVQSGYTIEYWNLSGITFHESLTPIHVDGVTERFFTSKNSFNTAVKENAIDTVFMLWFGFSKNTAFIFYSLSRNGCETAIISNGLLPSVVSPRRSFNFQHLFISIKERLVCFLMKTALFHPAAYSFSTASSSSPRYKTSKQTVFAKCNSGDYEALVKNNVTYEVGGQYFLFLDQYVPYHNDNRLSGLPKIDDKKYYKSLNSFFSELEKKYGIPVIIAAHPSASTYNISNPFEGRDFYFNKTMALAPGSAAILTHFTTAISAAVVYNKPIILLTSDEIISLRPLHNSYIEQFSFELGAPVVNMDHTREESFEIKSIDEKKYKDYKYKYLTNPETENTNNFENISKVIN